MRKIIIFIFLITQFCFSQNAPEISILTCSPGEEVYSVFGHSAIRIVDNDKDIIYNFGMFDFDTPNFTLKFVTGRLKYQLGIQETDNFIKIYSNENRKVSEQRLKLQKQQKNELIEKLNFLYKPENRYYTYSFIEKNCSTEIRDLLIENGVKFPKVNLEKSNRDLINSHLITKPWLRFGTNLMLGKSLDEKSNKFQSMFLPKYLEQEINNSTINGHKLVKSGKSLNNVKSKEESELYKWTSPIVIFSILLIIYLFTFYKPLETIFSLCIGTIGLILLLMWIFSEHPEVNVSFPRLELLNFPKLV
ncbi:lipoprotein N-acyltransferase Lnb domain-containing protein [Leeuwenhoekiella sp. H156]|uniref:lipoprotein N-acyltransferase Lnb domain-containing protein n=1 Tax=Leeuwenhoekiella sp. H156 TaxID=3450128 RepID=UPI003FA473BC